jgi:beta-glucosidase
MNSDTPAAGAGTTPAGSSSDDRDFPSGFLWGSATAAHQVEGGNTNSDWWAWEHTEGTPARESSGDAIDHWNRYDQDFALLASLGQNAHRFSFEWARIEPADGEFSTAALDHYARVLDSLRTHEMTAFGTLYHFSLPRWFAERGGWLASDALDRFGRYVERVSAHLGDLVPWIGTINEPQILAQMAYAGTEFPPGAGDLGKAIEVNNTLASAHLVAVERLRAGRGAPMIGTCLQIPHLEPLRQGNEDDARVIAKMREISVQTHLDALKADDPGDFVGLQYYSRVIVDGSSPTYGAPPPEGAELTQMGWEVYPDGLVPTMRELATAGLPIVITENGIATADDAQRVRFLRSHLRALADAVAEGIDVRGYFHWSSFDNFEWAHGYSPTFGLIGIDREDGLRRVVRPSALMYGEVARTGSLAALERTLTP